MERKILDFILDYAGTALSGMDDEDIFNRISLLYDFSDVGADIRDEFLQIIHAFKDGKNVLVAEQLKTLETGGIYE